MRTLIVCSMLASTAGAAAQEPTPIQTPMIVTTGEAVVRRAPDRAYMSVTVESRAKNPRDAQRQNAEAMTAVQQRLAPAGIGKDAVRTLGYDLQQEFDFVQGRRIPREFVARNSIDIRVDDVNRVGEVMDLVVQGGATSLGGVRFDLQDRTMVEREALRQAVTDARGRAEAAAAGAGRSIDRILRIEDQRDGSIGPPVRPMAMARTMEAAPTPIEPGLIEIRGHVTLTVSIR